MKSFCRPIRIGVISVSLLLLSDPLCISPSSEVTVAEESIFSEVQESEEEIEYAYTEDDLYCLAACIYNEAGSNSCSDETRYMVGAVVLNRVKDERFPDSIRDVLQQPGQYGMSGGVKFASRSSNKNEQEAVKRAYNIAEDLLRNGHDIPENVVWQSQFVQGDGIYKYQDNTYFCY